MSDNKNIEIDEEFIKKFYELAEMTAPSLDSVDLQGLKKQLTEIEQKIKSLKDSAEENANKQAEKTTQSKPKESEIDLSDFATKVSNVQKASEMEQLGIPLNYNQSTLQFIEPTAINRTKRQYYDEDGHPVKGKVLVVDDLGIIIYQLSVILKRAGYLPVTSKEIYDAIEQYKRSSFDYVIMDLYIPTEREGFILLEELQKIAHAREEVPVIAVMSASTRKDHKQTCQKKGAAFYVEKQDDWQRELFGLLVQY